MLEDGLIITVTGMSVVFMFLTLLVFGMIIMSKIVVALNKIFPENLPEAEKVPVSNSSANEDIAVAIAVAKMKMN